MNTKLGLGIATAIAPLLLSIGQAGAVTPAPVINACVSIGGGIRLLGYGGYYGSQECNPYTETPISWSANSPGVCADSDVRTYIMFPFLTNQAGFDTGISIANTTSDPFGTTKTPGACTLNFFGANAPSAVTTPSIAAGTLYTNLMSTVAPNFQGYMIASCNFPLAHGFTFVSDLGARNLAMGYLPFNICSPRIAPQ